jgi:hypothetical protein
VSQTKRRRSAEADERLKRENERLRRELAERERQLAQAAKDIADAKKQIADLERQLALRHQNSTITSKPPASDGLAGQQRVRGRRRKSPPKAAGNPVTRDIRERSFRPSVWTQSWISSRTRVRSVNAACRRATTWAMPAPSGHRIAAHRSTHHRISLPSATLSPLRHVTQAALPDDVIGQFGLQLTSLIAYLTVVCRLLSLVVQRLLEGALQIPISVGSTQNAWEEASAAVATPYAELSGRIEPVGQFPRRLTEGFFRSGTGPCHRLTRWPPHSRLSLSQTAFPGALLRLLPGRASCLARALGTSPSSDFSSGIGHPFAFWAYRSAFAPRSLHAGHPMRSPGVTTCSSAPCQPHTPWSEGWMENAFVAIVPTRPCPLVID